MDKYNQKPTIRLSDAVKKELEKRRITPDESYENVIKRLLEEVK